MQQTKSYWRMGTLAAVAGVISAFVGSACTVTTSTDDGGAAGAAIAGAPNTSAGAGGATTTAGASGASNTAGASDTAGNAGMPAVPFECTPDSGDPLGTANSCDPQDPTDACEICIKDHCCTEFSQCFATDPGNQCGWGGPNNDSEIICVQDCIKQGVTDNGVYDDSLVLTCGAKCATNPGNGGSKDCGGIVGQQTSDLVGCMADNCKDPCFVGLN